MGRATGLVIGLCLLLGALFPGAAFAAECTDTWTGAVSSEWQVAENWSAEHVPTSTDVACIPKEETAQVVSGTHSVEVLQGEGRLTILGGSLALLGGESSHIQKLHLGGGALKGPAELLVTEFLNADGGSMEGAGNTVIGAEATGHVDALEVGEGPGLRLTEKRELNVKGVLEVAGLGGKLNAIEGAFLGVVNEGELAVKGPEGTMTISESADLVIAKKLTVSGPNGQVVLKDHATLLNSKSLLLESPSGGIVSRDEAAIENTGTLTMEASAGEIRAEGSSIDNSGTLAVKAPEGRIQGSEGATFDNSGTLVVNGEGAGNGLIRGLGTVPKLTNTGTVRKSEGTEVSVVEFKVDNEALVEAQSGALMFTAGGNSGQEHLDEWKATAGEAQIVFAEGGAFTFGEKSALAGLFFALESTSLKGHRFEAEEAEVWLMESSLEITGTEEESRFETIGTSAGEADLVKDGILTAEEIYVESGSFEAGAGATITAESLYQEEGETKFGGGSSVAFEFPYVEHGLLSIGAGSEADLGVFFQQEGETTIGAGSSVQSSSPFIEQGPFTIGANSTASLGRFFQVEGETTFGTGSSVEAEDPFVRGGTLAIDENASFTAEKFYLQEGTVDVSAGASANWQEAYFQAGALEGAGSVVADEVGWETTVMSGSGSTRVNELGGITAGAAESATLDERRLITKGFFTLGEATLVMADGAKLQNEAEFDASSEASAFGPQLRVAGSSTVNPKIINKHQFNKEEGTGTTEVTVPFENNGSIGQFSGRLHITNRLGVPASQKFGHRCNCGDPVEAASGDFTESQTDFSVGGRGIGLVLTRSYDAQAAAEAASPGIFGYGWLGPFGDRLQIEEEGALITVVRANGSTVPFTSDGKGGFDPPVWSQGTLSGSAEAGYTYTDSGQVKRHFAASGSLQSVTDRNGNETTLAYTEAGRLKTITDPAERQITLSYDEEGLVESAEDPMGHTVHYGYEGKELTSVTMPGDESPRWQFEYDPSHRLTKTIDGRGGETTNEYDGASRVVSQTDPAGRTLTFEYDGFHTRITNEATGAVVDQWFNSDNEPTSITDGYGTEDATTETFTYDEAGHQLSETDGNGHTTTYTYNPAGDRASMTDADENETNWEYNGTHDVVSETTPNGETTTIVRDAQGDPETVSRPAPGEATQTTSYEYDAFGQLENMTDPLSRTWSFEYDPQGDRKAEIDPEGDKRTWSYDEDSQLISAVSPRGNAEGAEASEFTTKIERDPQGRPEVVIDPLGHETEYAYDANGNLKRETDAKGHTTKFFYDPDDELVETKKPNGDTVKTEYDGGGQVIAQTDGNGDTTSYVRNVLGQATEIVDPLERKTVQTFDNAGNLETVVDPMERITDYAYDPADRLREIAYSSEATPDVNFEYDPDGSLTRLLDGSGESTYAYDQLGRLEEATDGHGDSVAYEYNLGNEQERIVYPNGKGVDRTFDGAGRLESVTDWLGKTTSFSYDPDSNLEATHFPAESGNVDEFGYDRVDRMISVAMKKGPESLASIAYERDPLGQVEAMSSEGLPGPEEATYEYDKNNRLVKAGAETFEYDKADNPIKISGSTNSFDKASQLEAGTGVTYEYNPVGERTKSTPASGPASTYAYDQAGNLTSVKRAAEGEIPGIDEAFSYDGLGLMTTQTIGEAVHHLTWDTSAGLPLLLNDGQNSYLYGPGSLPVEQISSEEAPTYLHHDQLGSTSLLTNAKGEETAGFSYGAYGNLRASTGTQTTPLGFASQYTGEQSELQYLRARFYDPESAQFLTRDPIEFLTGEPYLYALSNPLLYGDPTGLEAVVPVPACVAGPGAATVCAGVATAAVCASQAWCRDAVGGAAEKVAGAFNSIFGGDSSDTDEESAGHLTKAEAEYEEEHHECPLEQGKDLKREGEELLGRGHSDAAKERWKEWWGERSAREKKIYNKEDGPKPGKRNRR